MNLGAVAQLAERLHGMQEVRGSIPLSSTTQAKSRARKYFPRASIGAVATYENEAMRCRVFVRVAIVDAAVSVAESLEPPHATSEGSARREQQKWRYGCAWILQICEVAVGLRRLGGL